jgi:hypothetical protein
LVGEQFAAEGVFEVVAEVYGEGATDALLGVASPDDKLVLTIVVE